MEALEAWKAEGEPVIRRSFPRSLKVLPENRRRISFWWTAIGRTDVALAPPHGKRRKKVGPATGRVPLINPIFFLSLLS
jgi:hypothetical protein